MSAVSGLSPAQRSSVDIEGLVAALLALNNPATATTAASGAAGIGGGGGGEGAAALFQPTQTAEEQAEQIEGFVEQGRARKAAAREEQLEAASRMRLSMAFLREKEEKKKEGRGKEGSEDWLAAKEAFIQANLAQAVEDLRAESSFDERDNLVVPPTKAAPDATVASEGEGRMDDAFPNEKDE